MSERSSEQSSAEQSNERAVRANDRADERVAQFSRPDLEKKFLNYSGYVANGLRESAILYKGYQ